MEHLTLKNSRFYRDGVEVPAEIGNAEQIAILQKIEREGKRAELIGLEVEFSMANVTYTPCIDFKCVCGASVELEGGTAEIRDLRACDFKDEVSDKWDGEEFECTCGRKYICKGYRVKLIPDVAH